MSRMMVLVFLGALLRLSLLPVSWAATTVVAIQGVASHAIPKTLYGQMFEDISRSFQVQLSMKRDYAKQSGDGGLYGELLQNRAFQKVTPNTTAALLAWQPINGAALTVIAGPQPLSAALPNFLRVAVPPGATGAVGVGNEGFWGINVNTSWTYNASFYYSFPTAPATDNVTFTIALQSSSGTLYASSASTNNNFTVTVDGKEAEGLVVDFALLSLFPPTFRGRENGMRMDVAEALEEMKPAFFRFPGGNNLEGQTAATRWQWNETVGPLTERPGRLGDWTYVNTDGLGLLEYLLLCKDLDMIPIMGVWAGYALGGSSVTGAALGPYIQQAIDQINFVIGDPSTNAHAALRASLGHPEPFDLLYVEIGNEDFVGQAPGTYQNRWNLIVTNLTATFPQLRFIATSRTSGPVLTPKPTQYDVHVYQTPNWFQTNSFFYDSFPRDGTTYFEGEYAGISTNSSNLFGTPATGRLVFPTVRSAVGEAAFMTGLERNADIVFAAAYAPLLAHVSNSQWTPNLINFDSNTVYRSPSFYVQKLFSVNKGDEYLPSTLPSPSGTLFWSVTRKTSTNEIIVSNNAAVTADLAFIFPPSLPVANVAKAEILTGPSGATNSPATPNLVVPFTITVPAGQVFNYTAPPLSVSILTLVSE
ncbi:glycoside hydrolase family 51 protein [Lyophyllum atratum]|nr:glycoside hydrolase family 51 protein [Lyophyllum atratum]